MKSFEAGQIYLPVDQITLQSAVTLGVFRGRQALHAQQTPQILESLRQTAIIQSTESSNRIEGIEAPHERIQELVQQKTTPKNRPEQEIAGYRDVLQTIHASYEAIPFSANVVLQFHRQMYALTPIPGGIWKPVDNKIVEKHSDGSEVIRFEPVPAWQTDTAMRQLHEKFNAQWNAGNVDKLILIAAYVLDFLCIHPFRDGNGRMSRLLTLLLLYKADYNVGRFISLEKTIENTKETYYETLRASSQGWHGGNHDLTPWLHYLLGTFIASYREFESRVGKLSTAKGAKTEVIRDAFNRIGSPFRIKELEALCPTVSRDMIRVVLNELKEEGLVYARGRGVAAEWVKIDDGE